MRHFLAIMLLSSLSLTACAGSGPSVPGSSESQSNQTRSVTQTASDTQDAVDRDVPEIERLARSKIKHVFVIVQENHTFDEYYGLFPGVNGNTIENLGTANAKSTDCQPDPVGGGCQRPFLISANPKSPNYVPDAPDITGGDNGRFGQEAGINHGAMNGFLAELQTGVAPLGSNPTPAQIIAHNEAIGIESVYDCDTIPYLWYYAKNFALYDHYFQADTGPSTPGNIQLFAGQMGQTEAAAGKGTLSQPTGTGSYSDGVPISNDDNPPASNIPFIANSYTPDNATSQSYAAMPVLLGPQTDAHALKAGVFGFIEDDLKNQSNPVSHPEVPWAWYQEGLYAGNAGFSAHHAAPLYFDYINNSRSPFATKTTLRDDTSSNGIINDIRNGTLPEQGVFWVKGGNANTYGLVPADPIFTHNSSGKQFYVGDDDHPGSGSSDHQVAEAFLAETINAIAQSKYWKDSIIVVTWDDSGGFFDHLAPTEFGRTCPQDLTGPEAGYSCGQGLRLPTLVISPFAKTGAVVHTMADHGSVSKLIEAIFNLPNFGSLPDEQAGVKMGLSPSDGNPNTSNLLDALDENKLRGRGDPPSMAEISSPTVSPNMSCASLGIRPIQAPAPLPPGFETAGFYLRQSLLTTSNAAKIALPQQRDDSGD